MTDNDYYIEGEDIDFDKRNEEAIGKSFVAKDTTMKASLQFQVLTLNAFYLLIADYQKDEMDEEASRLKSFDEESSNNDRSTN